MPPSFTKAPGVSPSLALLAEITLGRKLPKPFPSLPARLMLLLITSGLLSRSTEVAWVFPQLCFLVLVTILKSSVFRQWRGSRQQSYARHPPRSPVSTDEQLVDSHYLADGGISRLHTSEETLPSSGSPALLQAACVW